VIRVPVTVVAGELTAERVAESLVVNGMITGEQRARRERVAGGT
jgi:hypothetical protein